MCGKTSAHTQRACAHTLTHNLLSLHSTVDLAPAMAWRELGECSVSVPASTLRAALIYKWQRLCQSQILHRRPSEYQIHFLKLLGLQQHKLRL